MTAVEVELQAQINIQMDTMAWRESEDILGAPLRTALESASSARALIEPAQAVVRAQPLRDGSEIEIAAREYQVELIAWQLERAYAIAEKRIAYLDSIRTQKQIDDELARCEADTVHWFEYYAWGFDPRPDAPLAVQPFGLFDFQIDYVRWLESLVFDRRASGLVEKARDMGATIGALNWCVKHWRFREGFSAMLTSATEDLVDSKKDPDTLFEKIRFALRLLPPWMLPEGFNLERDLPYMNIANPANGATITGAAPTGKVGRQRRRTVVLMDEFASWPFGGYPQYTALSATARSLLMLATPEGKFNKYAEVRHSGHANVFTMDWRDHPWKDQRWRESLEYGYVGPVMTAEQIAQEIERDYAASQPGRVFKQWAEEYCLITWDEMIALFDKFGHARKFFTTDGRYQVPADWTWCRTFDYGQTEDHPWIVTHAARPRANYPLSDSVFVFSCHRVEPTGAEVSRAQEQIERIEKALGWRNSKNEIVGRPEFSTCSHEAKEVRDTFRREHGENWQAWETDYDLGIPQMQQWFSRIETNRPNPIRPVLMGRSRIYFVALPTEYRPAYDERDQKHFVVPSRTDAGFKLLREELPNYHYPPSELGKPPKQMRPEKRFDDTIDTLRAIACRWGPTVAPLSYREKIEDAIPEGYKYEQLRERASMGDGLTPEAELAYVLQRKKAEKTVKPKIQRFDDFGRLVD